MPHVIVKLWPGKTEEQKQELADAITREICNILESKESSISIAFEEVPSSEWAEKVYRPDIVGKSEQIYKKPGYSM